MDYKSITTEYYGLSVPSNLDLDRDAMILSMKFDVENSLKDYVNDVVKYVRECGVVELDRNFKFWYHIKNLLLVLQLNDSDLKRYVMRQLIYRKFTGTDLLDDDSDSPFTIALESMGNLTDKVLHLLFSFRLLINVIPSLLTQGRLDKLPTIVSYIRETGILNSVQVANLRRVGLLYDKGLKEYSLDIGEELSLIPELKDQIFMENSSLLSNGFTPAGLILTDVVGGYVLEMDEDFEFWLPEDNRVMHIKELVVDGNIKGMGNIVAKGEMASGGVGQPADFDDDN